MCLVRSEEPRERYPTASVLQAACALCNPNLERGPSPRPSSVCGPRHASLGSADMGRGGELGRDGSLYKAIATEDNIKELLQVIGNAAVSDLNREDAAWALRVMTEPALAQRKRNTGLLINLGAVDPLVDMLVNGATHGCKEQVCVPHACACGCARVHGQLLHRSVRATADLPRVSVPCDIQARDTRDDGAQPVGVAGRDLLQAIAVLRNIARETSQRKVGHKIRKVIRQEAAKWAGLGTPESDARIAEMERKIAERGGVCVVKNDEEIARLMAEREAQLASS